MVALTADALVLHMVVLLPGVAAVLTLVHGDERNGDVTARQQAAFLERRLLDVLVVFEAVAVDVDAGVAAKAVVVDVSGACFTTAHYAHDVDDVVLTAVDDDTTRCRPFVAHREIKRVCNRLLSHFKQESL